MQPNRIDSAVCVLGTRPFTTLKAPQDPGSAIAHVEANSWLVALCVARDKVRGREFGILTTEGISSQMSKLWVDRKEFLESLELQAPLAWICSSFSIDS